MPAPLWHSDLRDMTADGPVMVRFKGRSKESKMTDRARYEGGVYIPVEIRGERGSRSYNIENADIEQALETIPTGRWYLLTATGRGDGALLTLLEPEESDLPTETVSGYRSVEQVARPALMLAGELSEEFEQKFKRPPTEHEYSFATSLMIRSEREGLPLLERDVPEEPSEDTSAGGPEQRGDTPATEQQLTELRELAEDVPMTGDQREEFNTWVESGEVTRIEAAKAMDSLERDKAEAGVKPPSAKP